MDKNGYEEFKEELVDHHQRFIGNACTSHPIFYIKEEYIHWNSSEDHHDHIALYCSCDDITYNSVDEWKEDQDEDSLAYLLQEPLEDSLDEVLERFDDFEDIFQEYDSHPELQFNGWSIIYGEDTNRTVSVAMTRSGAETFILQNGHRYGKLVIWVESQYYNKEYRELVDLITSGKLQYIG